MREFLLVLAAILYCVLMLWLMRYLWLWFVVPLGVPDIGVAHILGLSVLVSLFRGASSKGIDGEEMLQALGRGVVTLFVAAILGTFAHALMGM